MRIVSVVPNSAVRDARIIKQARTLTKAGHDVHVVGIMEKNYPSYRTTVDTVINIYRAPYALPARENKEKIHRRIAFLFIACFALLFMSLILLVSNSDVGLSAYTNSIGYWLTDQIGRIDSIGSDWFDGEVTKSIFSAIKVLLLVGMAIYLFRIANRVNKRKLKDPIGKAIGKTKRNLVAEFNTRINIYAKRKALKDEQYELIVLLEPDLIYCHEVMSLPGCVAAKRKLKVPLVYDAHEFYDAIEGSDADIINKYNERVHKKLLGQVDIFVTVSDTILQFYKDKYTRLTQSTFVLPNSVQKTQLPNYDGRLHKAAKLPDDQNILLYQGGISRFRMVHEIVEAAEKLPEDWSVVLMGSGNDVEEFMKMADRINDDYYISLILDELSEVELSALSEKTSTYFEKINAFRETNQATFGQPLTDTNTFVLNQQDNDKSSLLDIEDYVDSSFRPALNEYSQKSSQNISKRKKDSLKDELDEKLQSIFWEAEKIENLKISMHKMHWNFANKLTVQDFLQEFTVNRKIDFVPRVSFVDMVPQHELLLWTQGAAIGAIPYPITCENHWGCAPNKLWEYAAASVPIIATPAYEINKVIDQYNIGWVMSADPKAQEISNIISNLKEGEISDAKHNCKKFSAASYWELHAEKWIEKIDRLDKRHSG